MVAKSGAPAGPVHYTDVVIVGAGFSGLGMGIELKRLYKKLKLDFLILEKFDEVGGTWYANDYPGCACDIPSVDYSYSFEQSPTWSRVWSPQPEILKYLKDVADKYDLRRHVRFNQTVTRVIWDDVRMEWHVSTEDGKEYVCQFVVSAAGALHIPSIPKIEGLEKFRGAAFHSAEWDHSVDLSGKRVAVIGTGASAIQIVPAIVRQVAELELFQRTPAWVMPRTNYEIPDALQWLFTKRPGTQALARNTLYLVHEFVGYAMTRRPSLLKLGEAACKWNIARCIKDPELRRKLTPNYSLGCKRILNSGSYYRALASDNADVVTDAIVRITEHGIVTADGTEHPLDVIVFATGFEVTESYTHTDIRGMGKLDLRKLWDRKGIQAHRGVEVADMPNLFVLLGPNTGLGHYSVVFMIEQQVRYAGMAMQSVIERGARALTPKQRAQERWNRKLQKKLKGTVWSIGGCQSWYMDKYGHNTTLWSGMCWQYWLAMRFFRTREHRYFGKARATE